VWRALISGDAQGSEAHRRPLVAALRAVGLTPAHLAKVDADILMELLDIVGSRYQALPPRRDGLPGRADGARGDAASQAERRRGLMRRFQSCSRSRFPRSSAVKGAAPSPV